MREFKFRAWDVEQKRMSLPFTFSDFCLKWQDGDIDMPIVFGVSKNRIIIQQYTGLKDKNGNPIFEGDLVKAYLKTEEIGEITFDRGGFCFNSKSLKGTFLGIVESGFTVEVVGNIFEK